MRKRFSLATACLVFQLAGPASGQSPDFSGEWVITIHSPRGTNDTTVRLKQAGEKLTGDFRTPMGDAPLEGTVTGSRTQFVVRLNMGLTDLPLKMSGSLEDGVLKGAVDFGGLAEGSWSARRSGGPAVPPAPPSPAAPGSPATPNSPAAPATPATPAAPGEPGSTRLPAAKPAESAVLDGYWILSIVTPQGSAVIGANFQVQGGKISGRFDKSAEAAPLSEVPFEGALEGAGLKFSFRISAQGTELVVTMVGRMEGGALRGTADFGGYVSGDWTGKRAAAAPSNPSP